MTGTQAFELIFACNKEHDQEMLKKLQALPLEKKIAATKIRIGEWYNHYHGKVYVSFSGGKDSTVLLHIARQCFPDIEAVFVDTGLEYPEIRQFVKKHDNVTILRPKMRFDQVIKKYGYPVISKEVSQAIYEARRKPDGAQAQKFESDSEHYKKYGKRYDLSRWKFLKDSDIPISHMCCKIMKKDPFKKFEKQTGKFPIIGTMTEESQLRRAEWLQNGCNAFSGSHPKSTPMAFWTNQDVLRYIKRYDVDYCSVYGDIVDETADQMTFFETEPHYVCTGLQRTGCMYCMYGVHLEPEPNRFQRMKITHPTQYDFCMNKMGCGRVLDFINVKH